MKQSGFILPTGLTLYAIIGAAIVVLGLTVALKVQTIRLAAVKAEYAGFVLQVKAAGEAAELARTKDIADRTAISTKKETDHVQRFANLDAKYRAAVIAARVRANPGSGEAKPLSSAATELNCPNGQSDFAGGLERLEVGILALLNRCDRAIERTITGKEWIEEQLAKNSK